MELSFSTNNAVNVTIIHSNKTDILELTSGSSTAFYLPEQERKDTQVIIFDVNIKLDNSTIHAFNIGTKTILYNEHTFSYNMPQKINKSTKKNASLISYESPLAIANSDLGNLVSAYLYKFNIKCFSAICKWELNNNNMNIGMKGLDITNTHMLKLNRKLTDFKVIGSLKIYVLTIPPDILKKNDTNYIIITDSSIITVNNIVLYAKINTFNKSKQYFAFKSLKEICSVFSNNCNFVMHYNCDPVFEPTNISITIHNSSSEKNIIINNTTYDHEKPITFTHEFNHYQMQFTFFGCNFDIIIGSSINMVIHFMKHNILINDEPIFDYMFTKSLLLNIDGRKPYFHVNFSKNVFII